MLMVLTLVLFPQVSFSQNLRPLRHAEITGAPTEKPTQPGISNLQLRGYAQLRYNQLFDSNPDLKCTQCDRSLGSDGGIFLRRARLILFGDLHPRIYFYFQPDFASSVEDRQHMAQLRDLYFDLALNESRTWRLRLGQSKVPFGFENLQSSSNRLALDRNDALNSAVVNERDMGAFVYWIPESKRRLYEKLTNFELKGSGDYGLLLTMPKPVTA